jgi:hypothetical protein
MVASERDRPDIARRREQWAKYQGRIEPERLALLWQIISRHGIPESDFQ